MRHRHQGLKVTFAALVAVGLLATAIAQVYQIQTNVTDSNGRLIATATTQLSLGAPATSPSATTQATGDAQPAGATVAATAAGPGYPAMPGKVYPSDAWLKTFSYFNATAADPAGWIDLTLLIPANACIVCARSSPLYQAGYYTDGASAWQAAIGNGSKTVLFLYGGGDTSVTIEDSLHPNGVTLNAFSPAMVDFSVQSTTGTAARPIIISSIDSSGVWDQYNESERPILENNIPIAGNATPGGPAWDSPIQYVIYDRLRFYNPTRDPSSSQFSGSSTALGAGNTAIGIAITSSWAQGASGYFLFEDLRSSFFHSMFDLENDQQGSQLNTVIIRRCVCDNNYAGQVDYGSFDSDIQDLLVADSTFDLNGWNPTVTGKRDAQGREHDWYDAIWPSWDSRDPLHRFVNDIFARPMADGIEGNAPDTLIDHPVFVACPIAGYCGAGGVGVIQNYLVDGGSGSFDVLGPGSGLSLTWPTVNGNGRGWGVYLDCATTGSLINGITLGKGDANDAAINPGQATGVHCEDAQKGLPNEVTAATLTNVRVHDWYEWNGGASNPSAANVVNLSNAGPPQPTIAYGNCVLPGVNGPPGVSAVEPNYVDDTRCVATYAAGLGIGAVVDAPSFLTAADDNWSGNYNVNLTATPAFNWVNAGFQTR
jgi:hypothetical protein